MRKRIHCLSVAAVISGLAVSPMGLAHEGDKTNDAYVGDAGGHLVTDGSGNCVRTSDWSKDQALAACDPDLVKKPEPAPVAVAPTPPPPPQPTYETVSLSAGALFDVDKDTIKPEGQRQLDAFAERVRTLGNIQHIEIAGHTDSTGADTYNQQLSERRANSVKNYLSDAGIDPSIMSTIGYGETRPVADNGTRDGRAQNRRVEITLEGSKRVQ